jgi:uncharacterized cupin superfamily protein
MPNLYDPTWDADDDPAPAPFTARAASLGRQAGSAALGACLYEIPQGGAIAPFHFHHGDEELALVLVGRPTLRTLEGERELQEGEVVAFPRGPSGAHRIDNRGPTPARVLIVSAEIGLDIVEYPDSGKLLAWAGDHGAAGGGVGLLFRRGEAVPPDRRYEGEVPEE